MDLNGKKILLGVTGGIAAYKSCELLRLLQKKGAQVRVAMTEAATRFVAPLTFASLSKCPVYLKDGAVEARPFQHIDFPRWADLYLVVPCTANAIGKFVYGLADDPVSLCFMSCTCPRLLAPAMNVAMYNSPAVQRNLQTLRSFENTYVLESPAGELACGEVGSGRLMEPADIVKLIETDGVILSGACHSGALERSNRAIEPGEVEGSKGGSLPLATTAALPDCHPGECRGHHSIPAAFSATPSPRGAAPKTPDARPEQNDPALPGHGRTVLITAGRTEEAIDPVRYISNRSSGKTAVALASVFLANGYSVEVVAGPMEAEFPGGAAVHRVRSACEMHRAVMERLSGADALVHCAAVADYRPKDPAQSKIKDSRNQLVLELVPNPNILRDSVAAKKPNQVVVGFALETDHFEEHAQEKLRKSGADALLLNAPVAKDSGFGFDNVNYALVTPGEDIPEMQMGSKVELSETIVDFVNRKLEERHG
ncbi:MAG: bifunctional phosphopantothenoylcysteine decarboxylase/phosphopantothenate synthase [Fibrobacter sp.]|nr:bifunctional phosphopantothenoylcysteine decarboxylase/phosphopantothenate synthase [Fibrobacter sp.]